MEEGLSSLSRSLSGTLLKGGGIDRGCFHGRRIKFQIHQFCLLQDQRVGNGPMLVETRSMRQFSRHQKQNVECVLFGYMTGGWHSSSTKRRRRRSN